MPGVGMKIVAKMKEFDVTEKAGEFIADNPWKCIFFGLTFSVIMASGLWHVRLESDIRKSFSPENSAADRETKAYLDFYNLSTSPQRIFIHFSAKGNLSLLEEEAIRDIERIDEEVRSYLERVHHEDGLRTCDPLCDLNAPFHLFVGVEKELRGERIKAEGSRVFDHPSSTFYGHQHFIANNFFCVTKDESAPVMKISNVSSVVLWYMSRADTPERVEDNEEIAMGMFKRRNRHNDSLYFRYDIFGDVIANNEMVRGACEALIVMSIGFGLLIAFVCFVLAQDWPLKHLPILASSALFTPLLGTSAAFGLLCWFGYPVYSIQCVAPFLVLGIARSRLVFGHISSSITITSATNIVAFFIGCLTPTPLMSSFCLATAIALLVDYVLTYLILGPVVFLVSSSYVKAQGEEPIMQYNKFIALFSRFITGVRGKPIVFVLATALYIFSSVGVYRMNATFDTSKALPSDSQITQSLAALSPVLNENSLLSIHVNRPPVLSNITEYQDFYRMMDALESIEGVYGRDRTLLFLKEYEQFDRRITSFTRSLFFAEDKNYTPSYHNVPHFLRMLDNPITIQYENDPDDPYGEGTVTRFVMALSAKGMTQWDVRARIYEQARSILNKFSQFNATLGDGDSSIVELVLSVSRELVGSILVTIISMTAVCCFFVQSPLAILIITSLIASICYCLVGVLSWWGLDLDPVTQVEILMATGFSVDYTVHIAFHFCRAVGTTAERIEVSMTEMSAPLIEAGMSTLICMLPLIFVQTYAILALAKTIFAVVFLGLFHGILVLPVVLSIIPPRSINK